MSTSPRITGNQGLGAGVGRGLGEGATLGAGMNSIVSIGGLALSRVSNRFAVAMAVSSPNTSQPKLLAGLSSHTAHLQPSALNSTCTVQPSQPLACAHCGRKISALRVQKIAIEETVSPCRIVRRSWRSVAFPHRRNGRSFAPIGKQLVQLHNVSGARRRPGHIHAKLTAVIVDPPEYFPRYRMRARPGVTHSSRVSPAKK